MNYYINYNGKRIDGKIVDSNGIYDLVQFDIDPLGDLLDSIVFIIEDYFPNYSEYDENQFVYGIGIGGRLVVKGPGYGGNEITYHDICRSIKWCEEQVRLSVPTGWEDKNVERIYSKLHTAVKNQFLLLDKEIRTTWTDKCTLSKLTYDLDSELMHIDITKDNYKVRVFIKCFSARIAHQCANPEQVATFILQGGKAVIGYQLLLGEWTCRLCDELREATYDLQYYCNNAEKLYIFNQNDEDYSGNYESAVVIDYSVIAYAFKHVVYVLAQKLSEYDPAKVQKKEKSVKLTKELPVGYNEGLLDIDEILEREEYPVSAYFRHDDFSYYFDDWLFCLETL